MVIVGTVEDLTLFRNYLVMLTDATPFDVARVRASIRRDVEVAKQHGKPIVRCELPLEETRRLQAWIASQTVMLTQANRRHMTAMLQRLTFAPY